MSFLSHHLQSRFQPSRLRGFTLTELLTSLTILLVLSTIAVITYSQFRSSGEAAAAQQALFELEATQRFWHRDRSTYLYNPLDLEEEVGDHLTYRRSDEPSTGPEVVSVSAPLDSNNTVAMAVLARDGNCYVMVLSTVRTPRLLTDTFEANETEPCTAESAASRPGTNPWGKP